MWHFEPQRAFDFPPGAFHLSRTFFAGPGAATLIATLDYGGVSNYICYVAGEVKDPAHTIPRSILYAIEGVGLFYTLDQYHCYRRAAVGAKALQSPTVVSDFIERLHGRKAGQLMSGLVLWAILEACLQLYSASRECSMPAVDGQFSSLLARLCHLAGANWSKSNFLLGHVSIQSTERYLRCKQKLRFRRE